MPLNNIHVWVDDEVITHDDLNSIGEAVSQTTGGGAIAPTQLTWPLVAQGDIDMNGYTIRNLDALSGVIHVNDEKTLAAAIAEAIDGSVIVIDPNPASPPTATDISISGFTDLVICGYGSTPVTVGGSVTTAGITIADDCDRVRIFGLKFTGGTTGKPAVLLDGGGDNRVTECTFTTPIGVTIGSTSNTAEDCRVTANTFNGCTTGIRMYNLKMCNVMANKFISCTRGIHLPGDSDGGTFQYNSISGNSFRDVLADGAIYGLWTGSRTSIRGLNRFEANIIEYHASNASFNVSGYHTNTYIGNHCGGPATFKGDYSEITDNIFAGPLAVTGYSTAPSIMDGNRVYGAFDTPDAGTDQLFLLNNKFFSAITLGSKLAWWCGNIFFGGQTITTGGTYTGYTSYGLSPAS